MRKLYLGIISCQYNFPILYRGYLTTVSGKVLTCSKFPYYGWNSPGDKTSIV